MTASSRMPNYTSLTDTTSSDAVSDFRPLRDVPAAFMARAA